MSNKYTLEILREYDRLQQEALDTQKQHQKEIYSRFPAIKQLDDQISSAGFEIASSIFKGQLSDNFIKNQKGKITDLKIRKAEILSSNGYPVDYLELKYMCPKCKDTGYIGSKRCSCFKQKLVNRYYKQSNLQKVLQKENFDTFNMSYYSSNKVAGESLSPRKNMESIFTYCIGYADNFDKTEDSVFFYGKSGLGKTFLSNCIAKDLLDKGHVVLYQTASNLIELVRNSRFDGAKDSDVIKDIEECDFLIIDDLGTEPLTSYSQSELFNIINNRILSGRKMLISTNFSLEDLLGTYPERITSRILGNFTMFKFFGDDIRLKNRKPQKKTV